MRIGKGTAGLRPRHNGSGSVMASRTRRVLMGCVAIACLLVQGLVVQQSAAGAAVLAPAATLTPNTWPTIEPADVTLLAEGLDPGVTYSLTWSITSFDENDQLVAKGRQDLGTFTAGTDGSASKALTLQPEIDSARCYFDPDNSVYGHSCAVTIWTTGGTVVVSAWFHGFNREPITTTPHPRLFVGSPGAEDPVLDTATVTASGDQFAPGIALDLRQCRETTGWTALQESGDSCFSVGSATVAADGTFAAPITVREWWSDVDCTHDSPDSCIVQAVHEGTVLAITHLRWSCAQYPWKVVVEADPSGGDAPLPVTADASKSTNASECPSPIESYTFDFGDGTIVGPIDTPFAEHTYRTEGDHLLTVTVRDQAGNVSSGFTVVSIGDPDRDGDGVLNEADVCPAHPDPDQADQDADGIGDACDPVDDRHVEPEPEPQPDPDPVGKTCDAIDDPSWTLGYTEPVYALDMLVNYCYDGTEVVVSSASTSHELIMSPLILSLWSVMFEWRPDGFGVSAMTVTSNADGSVTISSDYTYANTPFEICFSPLDLIPGIGKGVSKALSWVPDRARSKIISGLAARAALLVKAEKEALEELLLSGSELLVEGGCLPVWVPVVEIVIEPDGTIQWISDPKTASPEHSWLYVW